MEKIYEVQDDKLIVTEQVQKEYNIIDLQRNLLNLKDQRANMLSIIDAQIAEAENLISKIPE